jgi:hypothetical protein
METDMVHFDCDSFMHDTHHTRIKQHAAVVDVKNLRAAAAVHLTSHHMMLQLHMLENDRSSFHLHMSIQEGCEQDMVCIC